MTGQRTLTKGTPGVGQAAASSSGLGGSALIQARGRRVRAAVSEASPVLCDDSGNRREAPPP